MRRLPKFLKKKVRTAIKEELFYLQNYAQLQEIKINLKTLNCRDKYLCIYGQLFGSSSCSQAIEFKDRHGFGMPGQEHTTYVEKIFYELHPAEVAGILEYYCPKMVTVR